MPAPSAPVVTFGPFPGWQLHDKQIMVVSCVVALDARPEHEPKRWKWAVAVNRYLPTLASPRNEAVEQIGHERQREGQQRQLDHARFRPPNTSFHATSN